MPTVVAVHEIEDVKRWLNAWKPGPGSRHEDFQKHGAPHVRVFQSPDDPRFTGLIIEVEDLMVFRSFLASPEGANAEAEDGVKAKTLKILNEVNR